MQSKPTIHILWEFISGPWGGGNQFLKALKEELGQRRQYADEPGNADIILFNSHHHLDKALQLKRRYPEKLFIHRIDGPIFHARGENGRKTDDKIFRCNRLIADGTIFQSRWSMEESHQLGLKDKAFETCIVNAPDPAIFHPGPESPETAAEKTEKKIRLVATSWSSNERKGFDAYHHLDEHLDFSRYSMTFIGNTDSPFRNIRTIAPLPSNQLAEELRNHDLFISASKMESCSNSFLEAMHCGLPALARNNSSHPELLGTNGLLFNGTQDILDRIEQISKELPFYKKRIKNIPLKEIGNQYADFCEKVWQAYKCGTYKPCRLSLLTFAVATYKLKNS